MANCISQKWSQHYLPFLRLIYNVTLTLFPLWNGSAFPPPKSGQTCDSLGTFVTLYLEFDGRDATWLSRLDQKRHCGLCPGPWNTCPWSLQLPCKESNCLGAKTSPSERSQTQTPKTTGSERVAWPVPSCSSPLLVPTPAIVWREPHEGPQSRAAQGAFLYSSPSKTTYTPKEKSWRMSRGVIRTSHSANWPYPFRWLHFKK